jgi:hypothetical protein
MIETPYLDKRIDELEDLVHELWCGRSGGLEEAEDELMEYRNIKMELENTKQNK